MTPADLAFARAALALLGGPIDLPWSASIRVDDDEHETVTVEHRIDETQVTVRHHGYDYEGEPIPDRTASTTVDPIDAARALLTAAIHTTKETPAP